MTFDEVFCAGVLLAMIIIVAIALWRSRKSKGSSDPFDGFPA
jgi:hypothetical protein